MSAQALLDFTDPRTGLAIGVDHARHGLVPPVAHLAAGSPVRRGWEAGRGAFAGRTRAATPASRAWLEMRLQAWLRGQPVDDLHVTPALVARLWPAHCPVSGVALGDGDAVLARANPQAAHAPGNLVVVSRRVQRARAGRDVQALLELARRCARGLATVEGLDGAEWARLALLASFATPLPHADAARLPLTLLPPPRLRLINPAQALQAALTGLFARPRQPCRIAAWSALVDDEPARHALRALMLALLACRMGAGRDADAGVLRRALEQGWADARLQRRWLDVALQLGAAGCEALLQRAAAREMLPPGCRWLDAGSATDGWALAAPARAADCNAELHSALHWRAGTPADAATPEHDEPDEEPRRGAPACRPRHAA